MTKKHFEAAATIVREERRLAGNYRDPGILFQQAQCVEDAFVALFRQFNPRFDADKFRAACQPKDSGNL